MAPEPTQEGWAPEHDVMERAATHTAAFGTSRSLGRRSINFDFAFGGVTGGLAGGHLMGEAGAGGSFTQVRWAAAAAAVAVAATSGV